MGVVIGIEVDHYPIEEIKLITDSETYTLDLDNAVCLRDTLNKLLELSDVHNGEEQE